MRKNAQVRVIEDTLGKEQLDLAEGEEVIARILYKDGRRIESSELNRSLLGIQRGMDRRRNKHQVVYNNVVA